MIASANGGALQMRSEWARAMGKISEISCGIFVAAGAFFAAAAPALSEPVLLPPGTWSQPVDSNSLSDCVKNGTCKLLPGPQTRAEYAKLCTQAMAPIPGFDCLTGVEIPITVTKTVFKEVIIGPNNTKVYVPQTIVEKPTKPVATCDKPVKLGLSSDGQCVPYSRLKDLSPADKPHVMTLAICRKYYASAGPTDPNFDDIALIQHNNITGATCYFQSRIIHKPEDGRHDGTKVASPMSSDSTANGFWLEPEKDGNGKVIALNPKTPSASVPINCVSCHDSDPFILSPWIGQVAKVDKWDPLKKFRVDLFGTFSKLRPWVVNPEVLNANGGCVGCHRFGGSSIKTISQGNGGLTVDNVINLHGFMPPGDNQSVANWQQQYGAELKKILDCVDVQDSKTPAAACQAWPAGTK
jgi:hypothetical protein